MRQDVGHLDDAVRRLENVNAVGPVGFAGLQPSQQVPSAAALALAPVLPAYGLPLFRLTFQEPAQQQIDHFLVWASPAAGVAPTLVGACDSSPCVFSLACPALSKVTAFVQTVLLSGAQSPFSGMPSTSCLAPAASLTFGVAVPATALHTSGSTILGVAAAPVADSAIPSGSAHIWCDQSGNKLTFRVRYPNGTIKTGTVNLT